MTTLIDHEVAVSLPTFKAFEMRIRGLTPLIPNRFGETAIEKLEERQAKSGSRAKLDPRNPEAEFRDGIYLDDEGRHCFPGAGIKKAIVTGAMRATEIKGTEARVAFAIPADLIPIIGPEPRMRRDHVVRAGSGNIAYRPEYSPWEMTFPVRLYEPVMSLTEFLHAVTMAGFGVGIGNWRPEKNGPFGTFEVAL